MEDAKDKEEDITMVFEFLKNLGKEKYIKLISTIIYQGN